MRSFLATALLLLALPAAAQQSVGCDVHRGEEIRCTVRVPMGGTYTQTVRLITQGRGEFSAQAQVRLGECGQPGSAGPVVSITNTQANRELHRGTVTVRGFSCPEILISNCQRAGHRVSCTLGFDDARMQVFQQRQP